MTETSATPATEAEPLPLADDDIARARQAIDLARAQGADAADALIRREESLGVSWRLGVMEDLERTETAALGLRVFVGQRQICLSSSDLGATALADLAARAVTMARAVPEDPWCGLADPAQLAAHRPELDGWDEERPGIDALGREAEAMEAAARAVPGVTNSEGATAAWHVERLALVASNGFAGGWQRARHSRGVSVLAGAGTAMQRDHELSLGTHRADLQAPEAVGDAAGRRAVRNLEPRKLPTGRMPVIFDPRVGRSLLAALAAAISGDAIARGTSFLRDRLGVRILPAGLSVIDDPHLARGLRARPFDAEGLATARRELVADGVLQGWLTDLRSARRLEVAPGGHAARSLSGPPAPAASNLFLSPGAESPAALCAGFKSAFYVTGVMGDGTNLVTGDYSLGAKGFRLERGEIAHPVAEVTIAGRLEDMLASLRPADDLVHKYGIDAPTFAVEGLTVAGS